MESTPEGMRKRSPRPHRALLRWEFKGLLRTTWLEQYALDPEFHEELTFIYEANAEIIACLFSLGPNYRYDWWRVESLIHDLDAGAANDSNLDPASVRQYITDVRSVASNWGLTRLPLKQWLDSCEEGVCSHGHSPDASAAIHDWCCRCVEYPEWKPSYFGPMGFGGLVFLDEHRTRVHVSFEDSWYPASSDETRADARRRLIRQAASLIDLELDRVEREHEQAGYIFPDTKPKFKLHIGWLYRRVAHHETIEAIAEQEGISAKTVRNATDNLACQLQLRPPETTHDNVPGFVN